MGKQLEREKTVASERRSLVTRARATLRAEGGPLAFVWLCWLVQSWLLLDFVREHAVNIPRLDDWVMITALTGDQKITLAWLWSQHNEHRIALPRLIYIAVLKLSGNDFRAGMFFDVGVLSASTVALIYTARKLRGKADFADAFFPLLLLHYAQVENLLWSFQIQFVCSSALVLAALCALARPGPAGPWSAIWVGLSALMLPLFGGNGLALVPALALCGLTLSWELRRSTPSDKRWLVVAGFSVCSIALTGIYFIGYNRPAAHPVSPGLDQTLFAMRQILSLGFGSAIQAFWPACEYLVPALVALTVIALLVHLVTGKGERLRTLRFGLLIGSMLTLVGGIAWARVGVYPGGLFASRYATLVAPLLCILYFSWQLLPRPQLARFAQACLFFVAAAMLLRNRDTGLAEGASVKAGREAARTDILHGVPLSEVAARYCGALYVCGVPTPLLESMRLLHKRKFGDFAKANPN